MAEINRHLFAIHLSSTVELATPPQPYDDDMEGLVLVVHERRPGLQEQEMSTDRRCRETSRCHPSHLHPHPRVIAKECYHHSFLPNLLLCFLRADHKHPPSVVPQKVPRPRCPSR